MAEAALGLDHAEIVVRILPVGFGLDPVAGCGRLACQRLVLVEDLVRIAPDPHVGTTAVEDLISIGRAIGIVRVMLLVMNVATATSTTAAAATTTAAPRPLTIVWSH
jgi:hypothetical protein